MKAKEQVVLVLQGGGALGAYQAGAQDDLARAGYEPDWVAGISIGAVNAAIICGNPPGRRATRLHHFWEGVSVGLVGMPMAKTAAARHIFNEWAASAVMAQGVPGFFRPRFPWAGFTLGGALRGSGKAAMRARKAKAIGQEWQSGSGRSPLMVPQHCAFDADLNLMRSFGRSEHMEGTDYGPQE